MKTNLGNRDFALNVQRSEDFLKVGTRSVSQVQRD